MLKEYGLAYDPALHSDPINLNRPEELYAALDRFYALDDPPTAIFIGGDLLALEAVAHLGERGIRVPDDVSIVGSSDLPIGALTSPKLSTVHIPLAKMAERATEMLLGLIENPGRVFADEWFTTHLIVRGSTGTPRVRV